MPLAGHPLRSSLLLGSLLWVNTAFCDTSTEPSAGNSAAPPLTASPETSCAPDLHKLSDGIAEIRRDQLNYKIERDLLKEAYSSNLETINLGLTIGLALLTVLGFLGVKSIATTRDEFKRELESLTSLRAQSESRLAAIESMQMAASSKVDELARVNVEQNQRLQILELQEKASEFLSSGRPARAIEYITIGLNLAPEDLQLLKLKAICLGKLHQVAATIPVYQHILRLEPNDEGVALNLCEAYLITGDVGSYDSLFPRFRHAAAEKTHLAWYFDAIALFFRGKHEAFERHAKELLTTIDESSPPPNWGFGELRASLTEVPDTRYKEILVTCITVLEKREPASAAAARLWPSEGAT